KMPAILPENLFIDRKEDAAKLKQSSFLNDIAKAHADGIAKALGLKGKSKVTKSTTKKTPVKKQSAPMKKTRNTSKGYTSVVDYMKDNKMDSSYQNRVRLAVRHGIKNYKGTESQNIRLLNILQGNTNSKPATKTVKYTPKS